MTTTCPATPAISELALTDISVARRPGQFALKVTADRQWVTHQVAAWSVGLRWLTFEFDNTVHDPMSPLFVAGMDREYLSTVEQAPFEAWMVPNLARHQEMHEAALAWGLAPGGQHDLPLEYIQVDRLLKDMLRGDGVEMHGPAEKMANDNYYLQLVANNMHHMQTYVGDMRFQLSQVGMCLPVLSAEVPIGTAIYRGFALDVDQGFPDVINDGVIGRPLGELVATGSVELDRRTITEVLTSWEGVPDCRLKDGWTRLQLESDLVELGK